MANNNIDRRIQYRKGSGKPEQPKHPKLNGNVFSIFPIPHEKPWYEDKPQDDNGNNGDDRVERSVPPPPFGEETLGYPEYKDYLEKLRPGAIPLSFPKFMDQIDMRSEDYFGKLRKKRRGDEGVMKVVAEPSSWQKKYLENFGYDRRYLDGLNRDELEGLFDDIMLRRATRGRA